MGFRDWVRRSATNVRQEGLNGITESVYELYAGAWRTLGWHIPRGTNIYEREWDVLVILDACRVDLMREVAPEYSFIGDIGSFESVGSMSEEWMEKTFTEECAAEISNTAYVTANVFSDTVLSDSRFDVLDEVWKYAWDDKLGVVPPRPVTSRAISVGREHKPERLIVHYMQPHHPFIADGGGTADFEPDPFGRRGTETVMDTLRRNRVSHEEFWKMYRANLRCVLEDVSLLLSNVDADTVVLTSDHGDAIGEWGIYDHPAGFLHPVVKNVPWVETTASDTGEYEPTQQREDNVNVDIKSRLRSLGYV